MKKKIMLFYIVDILFGLFNLITCILYDRSLYKILPFEMWFIFLSGIVVSAGLFVVISLALGIIKLINLKKQKIITFNKVLKVACITSLSLTIILGGGFLILAIIDSGWDALLWIIIGASSLIGFGVVFIATLIILLVQKKKSAGNQT